MQDTLNKTEIDSEQVTAPNIQINQNTLNIGTGIELTRESRLKITDAIKSILNKNPINVEVHEINEGEVTDND